MSGDLSGRRSWIIASGGLHPAAAVEAVHMRALPKSRDANS